MLRVPSPIPMPSANQYAPSPYGVVLYDQVTEEEKGGTWFTDCSAIYISIKQKVTAAALQPLSVTILRNIGKGKLLHGQNFGYYAGSFILFGRFNGQMWDFFTDLCVVMNWIDWVIEDLKRA